MPTAAPTAPAATITAAMPEALGMPTGTTPGGTFATMLAGQPTSAPAASNAIVTPPATPGAAASALNDSAAANFLQMALTSAPSIKVSSLVEKSAALNAVPVAKSTDPTAPAAAVVANATSSASATEEEPANALPQQRQPGSRRDSSDDEADDETAMQLMMAAQLPAQATAIPLALTPTLSSGTDAPAETLKSAPTESSKPSGVSKPEIAAGRNRTFATAPMRATPRTSPTAPQPAAAPRDHAVTKASTNVIPADFFASNTAAAAVIVPKVESQPAVAMNPAAAPVLAPQSEPAAAAPIVPSKGPVSSATIVRETASEPAFQQAKSADEPVALRPSTPLFEAVATNAPDPAPTAQRSFPRKPATLPSTPVSATPSTISVTPVSVAPERPSAAVTPLFSAPVDASSQPIPPSPKTDLPSAASSSSQASVLESTVPPAVNPSAPVTTKIASATPPQSAPAIATPITTPVATNSPTLAARESATTPDDVQQSKPVELVAKSAPLPLEKASAPVAKVHRQLAGNVALRNSAPAPVAQPLADAAEAPLPVLAAPVLSAAVPLATPVGTPLSTAPTAAAMPDEPAQQSGPRQQNQAAAPVVEGAPALGHSNTVAAQKAAPASDFSPLFAPAQNPANPAATSTFAVEISAAPSAKITSSRSLARPVNPVSVKTSSTGKADATLFPAAPTTVDEADGTAIAKANSTMMTMSPAPQTKPDEALASSERSASAVAASGYGSSAQRGSTGEQSSEHQAPSGEAEPISGLPSSFSHFAHSVVPNTEAFLKTLQAASPSTTTAMDALRHSVETLQQSGQTQMAIRLNLPGAGDVDIQLSLRGGAVHATMLTGSPELQDALRQQWSQFTNASTDPSVRLGELTVKADANTSFQQNQAQSDSQSRRQSTPEPEATLPGTLPPAFRPKPAVTTQTAAPKGSGLASWA